MVSTQPMVQCQVFEDLRTTEAPSKLPKIAKMQPQPKHTKIKFHHFRDNIERIKITLHAINTQDQPVDMLTKLLSKPILRQDHATIMGWGGKGNAARELQAVSNVMNPQEGKRVPRLQGPSTWPLCKVIQPVWAYNDQAQPR